MTLLGQIMPSAQASGTVVSQVPQVVQNVVVTKEWWEKLLDYGAMTVVTALVCLLLYKAGNAAIEWIPRVAKRWIDYMDASCDRADKMVATQETMAANLVQTATTQKELVTLHDKLGAAVNEAKAHGIRSDEFLALSLDALQDFVRQQKDPKLTIDWDRHIAGMRASLRRSIESR